MDTPEKRPRRLRWSLGGMMVVIAICGVILAMMTLTWRETERQRLLAMVAEQRAMAAAMLAAAEQNRMTALVAQAEVQLKTKVQAVEKTSKDGEMDALRRENEALRREIERLKQGR